MTKIAICGACGKMGRFIYDVISERDDCTVSAGIDKFGEAYADFPVVKEPADLPEKPDVIIDFSHPSALDEPSDRPEDRDHIQEAPDHQKPHSDRLHRRARPDHFPGYPGYPQGEKQAGRVYGECG